MGAFRTGGELARLGIGCRLSRKEDADLPAIWEIDAELVLLTGHDVIAGRRRDLINGAIIGGLAIVRDVRKNFESGFRVVDRKDIPGKEIPVENPELHCGHGPNAPCGLAFVLGGLPGFWHADNYRRNKDGFIVGDKGRLPERKEK